jgi:hypothetical protein
LLDALVAARWEAQSFKGGTYVDLYDFCHRVHEKGIAANGMEELRKAIRYDKDSVVLDAHVTGSQFQNANGLSVYFPVAATDYTPKYMNLLFARDTGWGRLVRAYLEATRRTRRDEARLWFLNEPIRRYDTAEVDPLHSDDIEARIVGVDDSEGNGNGTAKLGRAGGETGSKAGGETGSKAGGETGSKGSRGFVLGNRPDGFRRSL